MQMDFKVRVKYFLNRAKQRKKRFSNQFSFRWSRFIDVELYNWIRKKLDALEEWLDNNRKLAYVSLISLIVISGIILAFNNLFQPTQEETGVAAASAIEIYPGNPNTQYIQAIIDANPAGTTYVLKAGVHRLQTIEPDQGDKIVGEYIDTNNYASLNGSKILDAESAILDLGGTGLYYFDNQTQDLGLHPDFSDPVISGSICSNDLNSEWTNAGQTGPSTICGRQEQLFKDGTRLYHEQLIDNVDATGEWHFDYANDRIYMFDDPKGSVIETSIVEKAIDTTGGDDVTIANLVVEKYAGEYNNPVVGSTSNNNWTYEFIEIRYNSAIGISLGSNSLLRNSVLRDNAQQGYGANRGENSVIEDSEIFNQNVEKQYDVRWATGGGKLARTDGFILRRNYSHNNWGSCFWTDIDNINTTYNDNIAAYCGKHGIQHEISFDATIYNNLLYQNAQSHFTDPNDLDFSAIYIQNSRNVEVYNNQVVLADDNGSGIGAGILMRAANRSFSFKFPVGSCDDTSQATREATCLEWITVNNYVYNNETWNFAFQGRTAGLYANGTGNNSLAYVESATANNLFDLNTYYKPSFSGAEGFTFLWNSSISNTTFANFQASGIGQEAGGSISTDTSGVPSPPTFSTTVGPQSAQNEIVTNPVNTTDWGFRKTITIDNTKVSGPTDLSNFVMLVNLTSDSDLASQAQADGDDIIFTNAAGDSLLDFELVSFNSSSGAIQAWVKIPTLAATTDTTIQMYYGNATTTSLADPNGVWGRYRGVWHLEEDPNPGGAIVLDSTNNGNNLTPLGTLDSNDIISGQIGNAINFDASTSDALTVTDPADGSLDTGTSDFTVQFWTNTTQATGTERTFLAKGAFGNPGYRFEMGSSVSRPAFRLQTSGASTQSSVGATDVNTGTWELVSYSINRADDVTVLVDGTQVGTQDITAITGGDINSSIDFYLARNRVGRYLDGSLDEVRIASYAKTNDEIITEYNNQSAPETFYTLGSQSTPNATCQNSILESPEQCDDGNNANGDGCSQTCTIEAFDSANWTYKKEITIDSSQVVGSAAHTNFPVLISLDSDTDLAAVSPALNADGRELVFTAADETTVLDYEIVDFDNSTGALQAWVKIPTLSHNVDTVINMFYRNQNLTGSYYEDAASTWQDYAAVWHADDDPSDADGLTNAEGTTYTQTREGTITSGSEVSGKIGNGLSLVEANTDAIDFGDNFDILSNDLTLQAWVNTNDSDEGTVFQKGAFGQAGYGMRVTTTSFYGIIHNGSGFISDANGTRSAGSWEKFDLVFDRDGNMSIYDNGANVDNIAISAYSTDSIDTSEVFRIGRTNGSTNYWDGTLDEMRIRFGTLSADWLATEYNNQDAPGTFATFGTQEAIGGSCGNSILEPVEGEQCDDSNTNSGDGCSATCQLESFDDSAWDNFKVLRVNSDLVSGTSDLTDFPVLVTYATNSDLAGNTQADGRDIVFVDGDRSTVLDYEIVEFDNTTGELQAWVKIPTISGTTDTDFLMFYNNSGLTADYYSDVTGTWSDYAAVYHADDDPSDGLFDSATGTTTAIAGTDGGTAIDSGDEVTAQIGNGVSLEEAQSQFFTQGDNLDIGTQDLTLQAWVNTTDANTGTVIQKGAFGNAGYGMRVSGSGAIYGIIHNGTNFLALANGDVNNGVWENMAVTFDRDGNASTYENGNLGVSEDIATYSSDDIQGTSELFIGKTNGSTNYFDGSMDEMRIRFGVLTDDWLATEHANQTNPNNFIVELTDQSMATSISFCGDNTVQTPNDNRLGERCDDGNNTNGDGCSSTCNLDNTSFNEANWVNNKAITIPNANISGTTPHVDFPMWIDVNDPDLSTDAQNDADDVVFVDAGGNVLDHELEFYSNGIWKGWVRIPTLTPSVDETITMYYNNGSATSFEDAAGVWTAGYGGVWHLNSGQVDDKTVFNNDGTGQTNGVVAGKLHNAFDYNVENIESSVPNPADDSLIPGTDDFTIQSWIRVDSGEDISIDKATGTFGEYSVRFTENSANFTIDDSPPITGSASTTSDTSNWLLYHVAFDRDGNATMYRNGSSIGTTSISATDGDDIDDDASNFALLIGGIYDGAGSTGILDETRFAIGLKDSGWIETEYDNQNTPASFYTVGAEQSNIPELSNVTLNGGLDIDLTEGTTTSVNVTGTITDASGFADITGATGKLYRTGVAGAETCTPDDANCYANNNCVLSSCTVNTCDVTCNYNVEFFADPTDASSFIAESWVGYIEAIDAAANTGAGTSPTGVTEINSLAGFDVTGGIDYATQSAGSNTASTNPDIDTVNTGNRQLDLQISGSDMCTDFPTCSQDVIPVINQEYDFSPFTYGVGTDLSNTPVNQDTNIPVSTTNPSNQSQTIYWGIAIPAFTPTGIYTGTNTITIIAD